jgi:AraC-like DNA-binding protein
MVVREALKKLGLHFIFIELAEIEVMENISVEKSALLKIELRKSGLELLDDKNAILIESIKDAIIELIYKTDDVFKIDYNQYLCEKFKIDYKYLADLYITVQRIKIDQFILNHKIERIKEMIIYEKLTILEIAEKLNFDNVTDLYSQFQKATGLTPYDFKMLKIKRRSIIEGNEYLNKNLNSRMPL